MSSDENSETEDDYSNIPDINIVKRMKDSVDTPHGYDFETCDQLYEEFHCPICLLLMKDAIELSCGHGACKECLSKWEEQTIKRHQKQSCPRCKSVYDKTKSFPSKTINRMITSSIKIKCKHSSAGCIWTGTICDIQYHLSNTCDFVSVKCPYENCKEVVARHALKAHKQKCGYRSVTCIYCQGSIVCNKFEEHKKTCDSAFLDCPNDGCGAVMKRKWLKEHLGKSCMYEITECDFFSAGCTGQMKRIELEDHLKLFQYKHVTMMMKKINENEKKLSEVNQELKDVKDELAILKHQKMRSSKKIDDMDRELTEHAEQCELNMKVNNERLYFRISALDIETQFNSITSRRLKLSINEDDLKKFDNEIRNELLRMEKKGVTESESLKNMFEKFYRKYDASIKYQKPCELFKMQDLSMIIDMLRLYHTKDDDEIKKKIYKVLFLMMNLNGKVPWFYETFIKMYHDMR